MKHPSTSVLLVDVDQLAQLREFLGDDLAEHFTGFFECCAAFPDKYAQASESDDHEGAANICHGLRGAAASLGCVAIAAELKDWEIAARLKSPVQPALVRATLARLSTATRLKLG
jgi:HPt (histidine-containing phosphotransfer) domain-containing protein